MPLRPEPMFVKGPMSSYSTVIPGDIMAVPSISPIGISQTMIFYPPNVEGVLVNVP
jgi:hypothetical protein